MFGDQVYVRWSNFHVRRATFRSFEQLSCSASNLWFAGATFMVSDQVSVRWSNFHVRRATFRSLEQLSCPASNIMYDGASFPFSEQLPCSSSKSERKEQLSSRRLLLVALANLILTIICFHKKKCYNNKINFIFSYNRKDMACKFLPVYRK